MAIHAILSDLLAAFSTKPAVYLVAISTFILLLLCVWSKSEHEQFKRLPLVNAPEWWDVLGVAAKINFAKNSAHILDDAAARLGERPFRVMTDKGYVTILPPGYAVEIRNHPDLNFWRVTEEEFLAHLPGMDPFRNSNGIGVLVAVGRKQLTKNLDKLTHPLADEGNFSLSNVFGDDHDWKEVNVTAAWYEIVSRMSSRVYLGPELARSQEWLEMTASYFINCTIAVFVLRLFPSWLRPTMHRVLPTSLKVQRQMNWAKEFLCPVVSGRGDPGAPEPKHGDDNGVQHDDAIEWSREEAGDEPIDMAAWQLALSAATTHTTSDILAQTMLNLIEHPGLVDELRDEIARVLADDTMSSTSSGAGWTRAALGGLKLMDSVLAETMRLKPTQLATMSRVADADVVLPDEAQTVLPANTLCVVHNSKRLDPELYPDPLRFDGHRFAEKQAAAASSAAGGTSGSFSFVSTSVSTLGFGLGEHVCPGRFFAAHLMKIVLCQLLTQYDFRLAPGSPPSKPTVYGFMNLADRQAKVQLRRRKEG